MLSVYLADLNELIGKWIQLPMSRESLEKEVKEIIGNNEGYFITEYSTEYEMTIHSFMDIYELNELIIELQEIVQRHDATVHGNSLSQ